MKRYQASSYSASYQYRGLPERDVEQLARMLVADEGPVDAAEEGDDEDLPRREMGEADVAHLVVRARFAADSVGSGEAIR